MAVSSTVNIDGYGNRLILYAEETGTNAGSNTSSIHAWLDLYVVNGGHVASSRIITGVTGSGESNHGYQYYSPGTHRLHDSYFTQAHNNDGTGSVYVSAYFSAYIGSWSLGVTLWLTTIPRASTINNFYGLSIDGNFSATFTAKSSAYENRLRISIPNVHTLGTYSNYTSGKTVQLSDSAIAYIKNYTNAKTIVLGGVIETWSGGTKIGESQELTITCTIRKEMYMAINGTYKRVLPYVGVNNTWKEAIPYVGINGTWKEEA